YLHVSPNDTRFAGARSGGNTSRVSAQQWGHIGTSNGTCNNHGVRFVARINPNSRMGYAPNHVTPQAATGNAWSDPPQSAYPNNSNG
ncbi:hypothetical protein Tco_0507205, partial [Tanacetum coccineum]